MTPKKPTPRATTTSASAARAAEEPLTAAKPAAHTKFTELEKELTAAGWRRYHETVLSTFEDREGAVWRVMRMYTHGDRQKGGLIAVKSQVTRDSTPFIVLYAETETIP